MHRIEWAPQDLFNSNGAMEAGIRELFKEFVRPLHILDHYRMKQILSKEDIDKIRAQTTIKGDATGAAFLLRKLACRPGWFYVLSEILRDRNVKLQHIAELMQEEKKFIIMGLRSPSGSAIQEPSPSSAYIIYNSQLESGINNLFIKHFPEHAIHLICKYGDNKILTTVDIQNVQAKINNHGEQAGITLLLSRLVLYDGWFPVLLKVLRDDDVGQQTVADEMETITSVTRDSYLKMTDDTNMRYIAQHFNVQICQRNQLMDTNETDGGQIQRGGNNRSFLTSSSSGEFESDSAVVMDTVVNYHSTGMMPVNYQSTGVMPFDFQSIAAQSQNGEQIRHGGNNRTLLTSSSSREFESDSAVMIKTVGVLSVNFQSTCVMPANFQSTGVIPVNYQSTGVMPVNYHSTGVMPVNYQSTGAMPLNLQSTGVISQSERLSQTRASSSGKTDLMTASKEGNIKLLLNLINETSDIDEPDSKERTALMYAAFRGHTACVRLLISKGCDVNKAGENGNTALMLAVRNGQTDCLEALIESGADVNVPNHSGSTALMIAATKGHDLSMRLLFQKKCDPDITYSDGKTALMFAAHYGHSDCVMLLIENGCNVNIPDRSMTTALIYSARGGHYECIKLLLDGQADINQLGKDGNTAIMLAIVNNHIPCVELFIKRGADLNIVNNYGDSPLDTARKMKNVKCTRIIKQALLS